MTGFLLRLFVKNHDRPQDPEVRKAYGRLAGGVGIACNLLLSAGKLAAGLLAGSIAVMADAVNNLSDAASSVITLVGFRLSGKPADKEHPFGHARFEYIAGLAVASSGLVGGVELGRSSLEKIMNPEPVAFSWLTFAILAASILVKMWMAVFNRTLGRRIHSPALEATYADSRNDVVATAAVLAAALVAHFTGLNLDGWMGLAVAAFILYSGIGLIKDTSDPLLGQAPDPELVAYVDQKILGYQGVLGTHDLIVHDYGPGRRFASAHVEMSADRDVMEAHDVIDNIERDFLEQDNLHLIIHYDPIVTGDAHVNDARCWVSKQVAAIDPRLTIHDLRLVDGPTHTNYIFDVVVPQGFSMPDEELLGRIDKTVQRGEKPVHTVVTIDRSYAPMPR